jgi:alpha-1,3-glucosyltransferase
MDTSSTPYFAYSSNLLKSNFEERTWLFAHLRPRYNLIMLGLVIYTVTFCHQQKYILAAIAFSLSLLFKQMALYFALPVFMYLLSKCFSENRG